MRNWILRDLGDDQLIEAVERNTLEHLLYLPSRHPLMEVSSKEDWIYVDSLLPCCTLNFLFATKFTKEGLKKKMEEAVDAFRKKQTFFSIIIGPSALIGDENGLIGFELKEVNGYILNLQAFKKRLKYIPGFRIQQALTKATFKDVAKVYDNAFEGKGSFHDYFEKISSLSFHSLDPIKFFVGYLGEKPVIVGELYHGAGIAGLKVASMPIEPSSLKELSVDLVTKMLLQAREQGYHFAKAVPLFEKNTFYEELGFKKYCKFLKNGE